VLVKQGEFLGGKARGISWQQNTYPLLKINLAPQNYSSSEGY
jgi:hypothetical protein